MLESGVFTFKNFVAVISLTGADGNKVTFPFLVFAVSDTDARKEVHENFALATQDGFVMSIETVTEVKVVS